MMHRKRVLMKTGSPDKVVQKKPANILGGKEGWLSYHKQYILYRDEGVNKITNAVIKQLLL